MRQCVPGVFVVANARVVNELTNEATHDVNKIGPRTNPCRIPVFIAMVGNDELTT